MDRRTQRNPLMSSAALKDIQMIVNDGAVVFRKGGTKGF
jgi:hypothetical protein